jgi:hypothetical protein
MLPPRKLDDRRVNIILATFAATMAVNVASVAHAAQIAAARVARGARALRVSFGFVPR